MTEEKETRIVVCKKCGIRTRHEWQRWERKSVLSRLTGHTRLAEDWVCTKCGHRERAGFVDIAKETAGGDEEGRAPLKGARPSPASGG